MEAPSSFESPTVVSTPQIDTSVADFLEASSSLESATAVTVKLVTVEMTTVVPPTCVKRVHCGKEGDMKDTFMFQPTHTLPIWTPRIVFDRGKNFSVIR